MNVARDWNEKEIAKEAKVSRGLVHYVFRSLIELGYVSRSEQNRWEDSIEWRNATEEAAKLRAILAEFVNK